ncbi:Regulator of nonsense transcripts 1 [Sphaceloma murrayae]|uniref:Regulator of nonsense transcripts 1 n=1 Tax=Sphaceloma murrayae TaxID=2082308 RepID=A0A2K1QSF4_9PEZI|nr:Regulator of nonsense transcripts 1 [Sphaceloma murrayae]
MSDYSAFFHIDADPLRPRFVLELRLRGPPKNAQEAHTLYRADRVSVTFSATPPSSSQESKSVATSRKPHQYQYLGKDTALPPDNLDFSDELYHVTYRRRSQITDNTLPIWQGEHPETQHVFTWKANSATAFSFSRSFPELDAPARSALQSFKTIIKSTLAGSPISVVTRKDPRLSSSSWPWFASLPSPAPQTYWPWLKSTTDPDKLMSFTNRGSLELSSYWIERALLKRDSKKVLDWKISDLPANVQLATLPSVLHFQDGREYIAHVLGAHAYEEFDSKSKIYRYYNGPHLCDIIPHPLSGSNVHLILLHIPPSTSAFTDAQVAAQEAARETALPEIGERVYIDLPYHDNHPNEEWQGKVVRIPDVCLKQGWNVAVRAVRPPSAGQVVQATIRVKADFFFGHAGASSSRLRKRVIEDMLSDSTSFVPNLLLSRNNHEVPGNSYYDGNIRNFAAEIENKTFSTNSLNEEQKAAIKHFLTRRFTILVGPPGTGKSTVIKHILAIAQRWGKKIWACTDSNAAIDVIAQKHAESNGDTQPPGYFRVRPMFDENLPETDDLTIPDGQSNYASLPGYSAHAQSQEQSDLWRDASDTDRIMSLGKYIGTRIKAVKEKTFERPMYDREKADLIELINARSAAFKGVPAAESRKQQMEGDLKLRKEYLKALRQVQRRLIGVARGIFSTVSAASGPLVSSYKPQWLIMDEASQFSEAKAAFALLHAYSQGSLERILLVGDHMQLPPTLMAAVNPFAATGSISLFERLILGGTPSIQLKSQFRAHPSISAFYNENIYGGTLSDAPLTGTRELVAVFQNFAYDLAVETGSTSFPATNSLIVSVQRDNAFKMGSEKLPGSTSRINFQTAAIAFTITARLVKERAVAPSDILITAFYSDQVKLLKALFEGQSHLAGVRVDTVDGSQGSEANIQVVDCVVLGAGVGDTFGFLSSERRRVNVAMSRAMCGQVVIGHENMCAGQYIDQKSLWPRFVNGKREQGAIIGSHSLLRWAGNELPNFIRHFKSVQESFRKSGADIRRKNTHEEMKRVPTDHTQYDIMAFLEKTDAVGDDDARRYLASAGGIIGDAIDRYEYDQLGKGK